MDDLRAKYFNALLGSAAASPLLNTQKLRVLSEQSNTRSLYKYCSLQTAHRIITSGTILLQPPDSFNDPFDCLARVNVWNPEYRFAAKTEDIRFVQDQVRSLPERFQFPGLVVIDDLRASYSFAISCFTTDRSSHLMWSHYAEGHQGVCLEFPIEAILDNVHPCFYVDELPKIDWRSDNLALSLLKGNPWRYEAEWRSVKQTIRPKMRLWGQVSHQIYNRVHADKKFTRDDHLELAEIGKQIMEELETRYNRERLVHIEPIGIYFGIRNESNLANVNTSGMFKEIVGVAQDKCLSEDILNRVNRL